MPVPVHVVAGFLGVGKTTTLLHLLSNRPEAERVAVVVNDFGESAFDRERVSDSRLALAEIRGSCVCCTAPEGFVGAVGELLEQAAPDRIFVEPTGLARPADLVDTLRRAPFADRLEIAPLIVVVDPARLEELPADLRAQAAVADVLVANRVDLASDEDLAAFDRWVEALWPGPVRVVKTTLGQVPDDVLAWPAGEGARRSGVDAHDHDHDHGFVVRSLVWPLDVVFHRGRLVAALERLAEAGVARLKGVFRTEEGPGSYEVAGGRLHEGPTGWRRDSRVDVIASAPGDELLRLAEEGMSEALLRDDERLRSGTAVEVALPDGRTRVFDRGALEALPGQVPDVAALVPKYGGRAAPVAELLDAVGAPDDVDAVVVARDGYVTPPVPVDALRTAVLLHTVDGEPLAEGRGGPFRLLIPGDAGPGGPCANVKGVVRIALRPRSGSAG